MKRFHYLLKLANLQDQKENLVLAFSNQRTEHADELTGLELLQLCNYLQDEYNKSGKNESFMAGDKMRKHIIAMAKEMGWKLPNGKADMEHINNWCKQQFGKKELNGYTYTELGKLVSIFKEKVYEEFLKKV
ncbi:hypothetical protein [Pinibacter soli]|uniref:DUF1018 domain-containing protein n=1 Tax=Pinibacter soli TaxID=3044211 RepID=A0ABT6R9A9_9BACT|nr:hypothetical protein [Pinibacter soli]MDI3319145.1 hypothetical protein [Pinibacter soli]